MHSLGSYVFREVYDFGCGSGTEFWYIIKDRFLGMEERSSKTRNLVRLVFRSLRIEKITCEILLRKGGYDVYKSAFGHYKDHTTYEMLTEV